MLQLPDVTLACASSTHVQKSLMALESSSRRIHFSRVVFFSHSRVRSKELVSVVVPRMKCTRDYGTFMMKRLHRFITTPHVLVVQWDGYVVNPSLWDPYWMQYDYIGAPWWFAGHNVGNSGFSLQSLRLLKAVSRTEFEQGDAEDGWICRKHRPRLEAEHGIVFAPEEVAARFSWEPNEKYQSPHPDGTFGFHGRPEVLAAHGVTSPLELIKP